MTKKVLATGTFDILHPGHIYFLKNAKKYGDELHVIISRDLNIYHKPKPIINEIQRAKIISELKCVDYVHLGDLEDYFRPVKEIKPDIIILGFDQNFDESYLKEELNNLKLKDTIIIRLNQYKNDLCSSSSIIKKILHERSNK